MSIFFIADTHFGDERILRYENRLFESVDKMNSEIIKKWNERVKDDDSVYLLGDVGDESFLKDLSGKKFLVKGTTTQNRTNITGARDSLRFTICP